MKRLQIGSITDSQGAEQRPFHSADLDDANIFQTRPRVLSTMLSSQFRMAVVTIVLFFGCGLGWSWFAPLTSVAVAPGVVSPESSRHPVQHLEGGILIEVLITDGDRVASGQPLLELTPVEASATLDTLRIEKIGMEARLARLRAERNDQETMTFSSALMSRASDPRIAAILAGEREQFLSQRSVTRAEIESMDKVIAQIRNRIKGVRAVKKAQKTELALLRKEMKGVQTLVDKGNATMPRLLALQRNEASLVGRLLERDSSIDGLKELVVQTEADKSSLISERLTRVNEEITRTQNVLWDIDGRMAPALDRMNRTVLRAPVDGIVMGLLHKAPGPVVRPGETLLEIVPENDEHIIEARLSALDIDVVAKGSKAEVLFTSYGGRYNERISGSVDYVSADAVKDETSTEVYYLAHIKVAAEELEANVDTITLRPGMPAEVFIEIEKRTLFDYLVDPIRQTFERGMREN